MHSLVAMEEGWRVRATGDVVPIIIEVGWLWAMRGMSIVKPTAVATMFNYRGKTRINSHHFHLHANCFLRYFILRPAWISVHILAYAVICTFVWMVPNGCIIFVALVDSCIAGRFKMALQCDTWEVRKWPSSPEQWRCLQVIKCTFRITASHVIFYCTPMPPSENGIGCSH